MLASRRSFFEAASLGGAAILAGGAAPSAPATSQPVAPGAAQPGTPAAGERPMRVVSMADVEAQAHARMSEAAWAFIAEGSGDQWTLAENRRAFNDFPIVPRRLRGVDGTTLAMGIQLLGHDLPYPVLVAPSGAHLFAHPTAEAATAGDAGRAGTLYTASGASNLPLEEIAKATPGPKWFQVYLNSDEGVTRDILMRAKAAGYTAIVLTADALGPGMSDHFIRLGRPFPPGMTFGNNDPRYGGRGNFLQQKTALTLDDIGMIRTLTGLPVVVKGILRGADAKDAVSAGAAAIQVSNHGGRQIDGVPASVTALPEVVDAVAGQVPVLLDGGIRRGIDVFRALALGATAVATARPILYGAVLGGPAGVAAVLEHLRDELHQTMLLAGTQRIADINRGCLRGIAA